MLFFWCVAQFLHVFFHFFFLRSLPRFSLFVEVACAMIVLCLETDETSTVEVLQHPLLLDFLLLQ